MKQPTCPARDFGTCSFSNSTGPYLCVFCGTAHTLFAPSPMVHNPISTESLVVSVVRVISLRDVLKAIRYTDLHETDAFREVTFGDAAYTLVSPQRVFNMVDAYLSEVSDQTYSDEQADRLAEFFALLEKVGYIDMEG